MDTPAQPITIPDGPLDKHDDEYRAAVIEHLTRKFDPSALAHRRGGGGKDLTYVEGHTVIHRLNDATNNEWDFRVISVTESQMNGQTLFMAHVSLTIPELGTRDHIGVQLVADRSGEDLIKGAITDGLKKAATLFGVALELYGKDYEDDAPQRTTSAPTRERKLAPKPAPSAEPSPEQKQGTAPISDQQRQWLNRLQGVCRRQGITESMLNRLAEARFYVPAGRLTQEQMTEIANAANERGLALWDEIAAMEKLRGMDHMRGAVRPAGNAQSAATQHQQRQNAAAPAQKPTGITKDQNAMLWGLANNMAEAYATSADELLHGQIDSLWGLDSLTKLSKDQASTLIDNLTRDEVVEWTPRPGVDVQQRQELFGNGAR